MWETIVFFAGLAFAIACFWGLYNFRVTPWSNGGAMNWGRLTKVHHFPWTDMLENVVIGFNLANGLRFGHETVVTHMPGIYQYLAVFFKLTGIDQGTPSAGLAMLAVTLAVFAISIFEIVCVYFALCWVGISASVSRVGAVLLFIVLILFYSVQLPLSENVITFLLMLQTACILRLIDEPGEKSFVPAFWGLTFIPLLNVLAGLTSAPSVAVLWLGTVYFVLRRVWREKTTFKYFGQGKFVAPIVLSGLLVVYEILSLDGEAFWFWIFTVNKGQIELSPVLRVLGVFEAQLMHFFDWRFLGGNFYDFLLVVMGWVWLRLRTQRQRQETRKLSMDEKLFLGLAVLAFLLGSWRFNYAFKSETVAGISWALVARAALTCWPSLRRQEMMLPLKPVLALGVCAFLVLLIVWWPLSIHRHSLPPRAAVLEEANVCRFRSIAPCRCLQVTSFGPQFFLNTDVRQCTDRYSSFARVLFKNDWIRQNLQQDIERKDVAFLVYPEISLEVNKENRDESVIKALYGGGMTCLVYAGDVRLCYRE